MLKSLLNSIAVRRRNFEVLSEACDLVVEELKALPYSAYSVPDAPLTGQRVVNGLRLSWSGDVVYEKRNGDRQVDIVFCSDLPTLFGVTYATTFWKRPE